MTHIADITRARGVVCIELFDKNGKIKERIVTNTVTDVGKAHIADMLSLSPGESSMSHMAIGTGSGQGAGDTTLANELDRNVLDSGYPQQGAGANDNDIIYRATWGINDGTGTITEAGIFNAASGGTMLAVTSFAAISKDILTTLRITWTITIG